jgi:hypothetical protein
MEADIHLAQADAELVIIMRPTPSSPVGSQTLRNLGLKQLLSTRKEGVHTVCTDCSPRVTDIPLRSLLP